MALELTDAAARERILTDLDRNLLVQAGAGAGKTHALIGRMVEVVRTGREDVQHLAAITFTKKAAGEMRARFHDTLRKARDQAETDAERRRLGSALDRVDQCTIGTIHAFCGRLLRERPLEIGLPPDFRELDERAEWISLRDSWDAFVLDRFAEEDPRLSVFDDWGVRPDDFFDFFLRRSQFTDIDLHWTDVPPVSLLEPARIAADWAERVSRLIPEPLTEKPDPLQGALLRAVQFLRNRGLEAERDARYLLSLLDIRSGSVVLKRWGQNRDEAREIRDNGHPELLETTVRPALTRWRHAVYPEIAGFIDEAVEHHRLRRFAAGTLTFQDLLEQATALLAEKTDLRRDFQDRYRRLFVDEFQDTDPLQAQIVLYLTSDDPTASDWRDCRPRPGSLFLVGDEKQAIYRFRRADLDVFRDVRDRVRASGGDVLDLNTSFRALGSICDWINTAFEPVFDRFDPRYQARFTPLAASRHDDGLPGRVLRSSIPKVSGNNRGAVAAADADRIARFIAASIAGEDTGGYAPEDASAGDFMLLTRTTGRLDTYARALERHGIPFTIEGSGKLRESEELADLVRLMEVVLRPIDAIPLIAHLRGRLVGVGDDELFDYRAAGGVFDYRIDPPAGLEAATADRFTSAFSHLRDAARWLQTEPVSVAVERILDDLGILPFAALRPMGGSRAGNLVRLLALVRRWEIAGWSWTECCREMRDLRDDPGYKLEEMTLDAGSGRSVRLMNLHQAKGLQSRVVFLADPCDTSAGRHDPDFHVSRSGSEPRLSLPVYRSSGQYGRERIAEPHGWEQDAEEEARFLDAEERRLVYVAATRAADLLVVSRYEGNTDRGPWTDLYPWLENVPDLPDCEASVPEPPARDPLDEDAVRRDIADRRRRIESPSWTISPVTGEDGRALDRDDDEDTPSGRGTDYGLLVHRILEDAVNGYLPADREAYVRGLVRKERLESGDADHALEALDRFLRSDLWTEIEGAQQVRTEVDFAAAEDLVGHPQLARGRIDLACRIRGGWKIVDFKTDRARTPAEVAALRRRYADQVGAYTRYWNNLTGDRVQSAGLWATDPGVWIEI